MLVHCAALPLIPRVLASCGGGGELANSGPHARRQAAVWPVVGTSDPLAAEGVSSVAAV